jgi:hypothetical protein
MDDLGWVAIPVSVPCGLNARVIVMPIEENVLLRAWMDKGKEALLDSLRDVKGYVTLAEDIMCLSLAHSCEKPGR